MKTVEVEEMLKKKYKTRMLVNVACHVSYERAVRLLRFLTSTFPRRRFELFSSFKISGVPTKYVLYYSLNCRELEEVISRYEKENEG